MCVCVYYLSANSLSSICNLLAKLQVSLFIWSIVLPTNYLLRSYIYIYIYIYNLYIYNLYIYISYIYIYI